MEKEQITIDGVDVSGCEFHQIDANELYPKAHYCGSMKNTFCENDPNCYYKQLVRKTQECEKLKEQLMQKDEVNTFFNTPIEGWSDDPCEICPCKNELQLAEQLIAGILKTLNLEAYDWRADQNEIITEIKAFKHKCESLKEEMGILKDNFDTATRDCNELIEELEQECEELKEKLKFKVQENIKLSKENRNLKNWDHTKGVEIKVNRKIKETNLEEFCRMFRFKEMQAREEKLKEWQDFENDLQWKFYKNCKEWTEMRDKYDRYRKALEEIEEELKEDIYCESQECGCDDSEECLRCTKDLILDIINKAKEGNNENT